MIWSSGHSSETRWQFAQVNLQSDVTFDVLIEGLVGRENTGIIAVDNIAIDERLCLPLGSWENYNLIRIILSYFD